MRGSVRIVALGVAVLTLAGCAGSTDAADGPPVTEAASPAGGRTVPLEEGASAAFYAPSGDVWCQLTESTVRCDVGDAEWPLPPAPADCELDWIASVGMDADGAPTVGGCVGDTIALVEPGGWGTEWFDPDLDIVVERAGFDQGVPALRHGSEITDGVLRCTMTAEPDAGVRCSTVGEDTGFFVSRARVEIF